jgi:hypothetical protein
MLMMPRLKKENNPTVHKPAGAFEYLVLRRQKLYFKISDNRVISSLQGIDDLLDRLINTSSVHVHKLSFARYETDTVIIHDLIYWFLGDRPHRRSVASLHLWGTGLALTGSRRIDQNAARREATAAKCRSSLYAGGCPVQ